MTETDEMLPEARDITEPVDSAASVTVEIDRLVIGRQLTFPIHDAKGILLLAAGSAITEELKHRLKERGLDTVEMHETDVAHATLSPDSAAVDNSVDEYERILTSRLESFVRSGMMRVRNSGRPAREQIVSHGRKPYDAKFQQNLVDHQRQTAATVDEMITQAVEGQEVDGHQLSELSDTCIQNLVKDFGCSLSTAVATNTDPDLAQHTSRVALLAMAMAFQLDLDAANVRRVGITGMVQDWGMAQVPRSIREANRPLTDVEFLEIQKHPIRSANLAERVQGLPHIVPLVVYQVHERPDGSGYPRGREGNSIHPFARILHVADAFMAMTAVRPHRPPIQAYRAMETLLQQARRNRVDRKVVRALLHVLSLFPIGSLISLSDGSVAQVIRANGSDYTRPIVVRVRDAQGNSVAQDDESALVDLSDSELVVKQALPTPGRNETEGRQHRVACPA